MKCCGHVLNLLVVHTLKPDVRYLPPFLSIPPSMLPPPRSLHPSLLPSSLSIPPFLPLSLTPSLAPFSLCFVVLKVFEIEEWEANELARKKNKEQKVKDTKAQKKDSKFSVLLSKARRLITAIKSSVVRCDCLRDAQIACKVKPQDVRELIQDVPTRWNSTYYAMTVRIAVFFCSACVHMDSCMFCSDCWI